MKQRKLICQFLNLFTSQLRDQSKIIRFCALCFSSGEHSNAMTHAVSYLLVCEGWRAVSHEPEDHQQSSPAGVAPLPAKLKSIY